MSSGMRSVPGRKILSTPHAVVNLQKSDH